MFDDFDDETLLDELEAEFDEGTKCNACYGTGLDREEDVDCMVCWGEGYI